LWPSPFTIPHGILLLIRLVVCRNTIRPRQQLLDKKMVWGLDQKRTVFIAVLEQYFKVELQEEYSQMLIEDKFDEEVSDQEHEWVVPTKTNKLRNVLALKKRKIKTLKSQIPV